MWELVQQKLQVAPARRAKRKHTLAYYVVGAFAFSIELMLGINVSFLVDQSLAIVAHNMLDGVPFVSLLADFIPLVISLLIGTCFVLGGMWTFAGFMDNLDDAKAYKDEYASNDWPVAMVWAIMIAVILLDLTTLAFRAAYFAEKGATALVWFFIILIFVPAILGAFLHVLENTPRDRRIVKAERHIAQVDADAYEETLQTMPDHLRTRYLNGDETAMEEHYSNVQADRDSLRQQEIDAMAARDELARKRQEQNESKKQAAIRPANKRERVTSF